MRQKNSYSRIIWDLEMWEHRMKGAKIQLFHHCVEHDITSFFIDSSGFKVSPKDALGTALSESGLSRDEIQLIGGIREPETDPEKIISKTEELLLNLKTDYLDLLLLENASLETVLPAVEQLKSQGKVMETGIFEKNRDEQKLPEKLKVSATLFPWKYSPAAVKMLTLDQQPSQEITKMLYPDIEDTGDEVQEMCSKYHLSHRQFLLAWLLQHQAYFHLILKGKEQEDIDAAVKAFHTTLIREDREKFPKLL